MSFRDDIINSALNWADPGQYKPTASELMSLFTRFQHTTGPFTGRSSEEPR